MVYWTKQDEGRSIAYVAYEKKPVVKEATVEKTSQMRGLAQVTFKDTNDNKERFFYYPLSRSQEKPEISDLIEEGDWCFI